MRTMRFAVTMTPEGEVLARTDLVARVEVRAMTARISDPLEFDGGMIVMSTDVNATSAKGIVNKAKGWVKTWANRLLKSRRVDDEVKRLIEERGLDTGWSVGNLFRGRYYSPKSGQTFNEKSFSVDIRGVPFDFVVKVAEALRVRFDQESVMVINHQNNKVQFVD
jgi:hypothetical protein